MADDDQHGRVPTYEGRPLARPHDEVVDQGLAFDVGTLLSRRRMLTFLGVGAAAAGLAACGTDSSGTPSAASSSATTSAATSSAAATTGTATAEIPEETAGPYPGDGSNGPDVLEQSGVVRSDIRSSFGGSNGTAQGVPMTVQLNLADLAGGGGPFAGVAVYLWHCDREGRYSMYSDGVTDQNYLRGVQVADSTGVVRFTSIFPGCYAGRWPHLHFEVYPDEASITDAGNVIATSQLALPEDVCNQVYAQSGYSTSVTNLSGVSLSTDGIFSDDVGSSQLATVTGDVTGGFAVSLAVGVDTATTPGAAGGGGGGGGGGAPGGPPPTRG